MSLSPLKSPSHGRLNRRRGRTPVPLLLAATAGGCLLVWLLWRFGFGLPARVRRAAALADGGQAQLALERLGSLAADHPDYPEIPDGEGRALDALGRTLDASAAYARARALGLGPAAAGAHCSLGRRALARGGWGEAAVEYDHAYALNPRSARALAGEAAVSLVGGRIPQALDLAKQALALDPGQALARRCEDEAGQDQSQGSIYSIVDREGEPLARQSVTAQGLGGITYPRAQLTAHVIGYLSAKAGNAGLERDLQPLFPECRVTTTLDARLQQAASRAMGWRKGAIVALDPATGEILCAFSQPSLMPERVDKDWVKLRDDPHMPLKDRALDGLFEPGSIAKIMTAAAALETGVDMAKIFPMTPPTAISLDGKIFRDWKYHGEIRSLKEAMDVSSNLALYRVAEAMGPDVLLRTINLFGFNKAMDLGFTMANGARMDLRAARPLAPQTADDSFDLANLACGLGKGFRVSPLEAARMAAVIANGGELMKPSLVRSVRSLAGDTLYQAAPIVEGRVVRPDTADRVRQVMIDTVEGQRGIGKKARVPGIVIAGKTGTSRTHAKGNLDAWFIGFAPADKPKLAVAVFCDEEGTGMDVAAPIAGKFLAQALQ